MRYTFFELPLTQLTLKIVFFYKTWFLNKSSKTSRCRINFASPFSTNTSAGFKRLLKLLLISKPYAPAL